MMGVEASGTQAVLRPNGFLGSVKVWFVDLRLNDRRLENRRLSPVLVIRILALLVLGSFVPGACDVEPASPESRVMLSTVGLELTHNATDKLRVSSHIALFLSA